jgi:hypothetical protein
MQGRSGRPYLTKPLFRRTGLNYHKHMFQLHSITYSRGHKRELGSLCSFILSHFFSWSVIFCNLSPQEHWCYYPILEGVSKFSRTRDRAVLLASIHEQPFRLPRCCGMYQDGNNSINKADPSGRVLGRRSEAARLPGSRVRILLKAWIFVYCVLCRLRPLGRADHSFRGVLPSVVCLCLCVCVI